MYQNMVKSGLISGGRIWPDMKIWPDFGRGGYDIWCNPSFSLVQFSHSPTIGFNCILKFIEFIEQ